MNASYSYLRQFVPHVLAAIGFQGGPGVDELMQALAVLGERSRTGTRKVPTSARGLRDRDFRASGSSAVDDDHPGRWRAPSIGMPVMERGPR